MEMTRRGFLLGGTALVAGLALQDTLSNGRVFFFPKEIKLAKSLSDSNYFVKFDELVPEGQLYSTHFSFSKKSKKDLNRRMVLRREIFDPNDWGPEAFPLKVEYLPVPIRTRIITPEEFSSNNLDGYLT
jgi:hypothetical protein